MRNKLLKIAATVVILCSSLIGKELVLVDLSGSMSFGNRGHDAKIMVKELLEQGIRVLGYNNKIRKINSISDMKYDHGSNLGYALEHIYLTEKDLTMLSIITDGDIGNEAKLLETGKLMKNIPICSVSVDTVDVPNSLKKISKKSFVTTDILQARKLCRGVRKTALKEIIEEIDEDKYNLF